MEDCGLKLDVLGTMTSYRDAVIWPETENKQSTRHANLYDRLQCLQHVVQQNPEQ